MIVDLRDKPQYTDFVTKLCKKLKDLCISANFIQLVLEERLEYVIRAKHYYKYYLKNHKSIIAFLCKNMKSVECDGIGIEYPDTSRARD